MAHRHPLSLFMPRPAALAVRSLLGAALLAPLGPLLAQTVTPAAPAGSAAEAPRAYAIPAGPLAAALTCFAAESGLLLAAPAGLTQGPMSPGLNGRYTAAQGFEALLQGSGLEALRQPDGSYGLRPRAGAVQTPPPAAEEALPVVRGRASRALDAPSEGSGSLLARGQSSATGLSLSLRDTPQAVAVITRERLSEQQLVSVEDVLLHAPGITFKKKASADDNEKGLFARGMEVSNMLVDGVSMPKDFHALGLDTALYDRIEVVRGATGLMSGTGNPAASINLIRKKPTRETQAELTASLGAWSHKRLELDVGGTLGTGLRARAVGAWQSGDSYIDRLHQRSELLYGVLEQDLGPNTLLTFSAEHQRKRCKACTYFGLPGVFADGSLTQFPNSYNSATNWSRQGRRRASLGLNLEHGFENGWKGLLSLTRHGDNNRRSYGWFSDNGLADPQTGAGTSLWLAYWPIPKTQTALQASLSGPFEWGGRQHELMLGLNLAHSRADYDTYPLWRVPGYDARVPNVFEWTGEMPEPTWQANGRRFFTERQRALYAAARLRPSEALSLVAGARWTWFDQQASYEYPGEPSYPDNMAEHGRLIPYLGAVYKLSEPLSLYASYTSIFQPQQSQDVNGKVLDPLLGKTVEAGLKGAFFDDRLSLGLALFRSVQDNYAVADGDKLAPNGDSAYVAVRGARIRGLELDLVGAVTPRWQVQAGYTQIRQQLPEGWTLNVGLPKRVLKLYSSYRLGGAASAWTLSGGLRAESASQFTARGDFPQPVVVAQKAFTVFDAGLRYALSPQSTVSLSLRNLTDKRYHASIAVYSKSYGEPFNALLSLQHRF